MFLEGIGPKVSIMARCELELAYYNVEVQYVSHKAMGAPFITIIWFGLVWFGFFV